MTRRQYLVSEFEIFNVVKMSDIPQIDQQIQGNLNNVIAF